MIGSVVDSQPLGLAVAMTRNAMGWFATRKLGSGRS
jgi:hypothetical protein